MNMREYARFYRERGLDNTTRLLRNRDNWKLRRSMAQTRDALAFYEGEVSDAFLERHGPGCPPCPTADRRWHLRNLIATIRALRAAIAAGTYAPHTK